MVNIALFGSVSASKIEKNLVLGVTDNLSPRKSKKFPFVLKFDETFLGHYVSRDEFNGAVRFVIRYLKNFLNFHEPLCQFIILLIFYHF